MRKNIFAISLIILSFTFSLVAQDKMEDKKKMMKKEVEKSYKVNEKDVSTIDGIITATYDSISGGVNEKRNWDRLYSLFHKDARLISTVTNPNTNVTRARSFTPAEYVKGSEAFMMQNGFFEKEISRKTDIFGNIAQVFSTYEGRNKVSDEKPFLRGINSFQLLNDGKRWWVMTIYWHAESLKNPLPKKYLETK